MISGLNRAHGLLDLRPMVDADVSQKPIVEFCQNGDRPSDLTLVMPTPPAACNGIPKPHRWIEYIKNRTRPNPMTAAT
jgi:hypothetical protein